MARSGWLLRHSQIPQPPCPFSPPDVRVCVHAVGYVEQHDTLLPLQTPYEMLLQTAELKLPRATSRAHKQHLVAALIDK